MAKVNVFLIDDTWRYERESLYDDPRVADLKEGDFREVPDEVLAMFDAAESAYQRAQQVLCMAYDNAAEDSESQPSEPEG